jgi:hypothetical protein
MLPEGLPREAPRLQGERVPLMERHQARRSVRWAVRVAMLPEEPPREVFRPRGERRVPLMERHSVQAELPCPELPEAARPGVLAGPHREYPARPSAAAARKVRAPQATEGAEAMVAQRLAQAARLVPPALQAAVAAAVREAQQVPRASAVQPTAAPEEAAARDEVVVPQPAVESAGVARQREAAVQDVAAVQRRAAGPASVAVRPRAAEVAVPDAEEAPRRGAEAEVQDAAVRRPGARDAQGARLSAAAWAGLPSIRCPEDRLAPSASARSVNARGCLQAAQP